MQKLSFEKIQEYVNKQISAQLANYFWLSPVWPKLKKYKPILGGAKDKTPISTKTLESAREWVNKLWTNL